MNKTGNDRVIMGIDPGTNIMGYGIIQQKNKELTLLTLGVLKLGNIPDQPEKLKKIFSFNLELIETYKPDEVALEAPFYGKNVQSMLKLGRAQGVAMAAALYRGLPIYEYSPRKVKQSITGRGAASKEQVAEMLIRFLKIVERPQHFDATDAVAVAVCHYFQKDLTTGTEKYSGWKAFISQNQDRIK
ncbi:MAG: crossover junction endodeoxyribonuclease RuvC [Bacteroidetes bacterium]|nr:crossover junction endodeoxyribonuclease RuvC [Bacteroidota bacterium]